MNKADDAPAAAEIVAENRALFEELVDSDLPISEDAERALDLLDDAEEG